MTIRDGHKHPRHPLWGCDSWQWDRIRIECDAISWKRWESLGTGTEYGTYTIEPRKLDDFVEVVSETIDPVPPMPVVYLSEIPCSLKLVYHIALSIPSRTFDPWWRRWARNVVKGWTGDEIMGHAPQRPSNSCNEKCNKLRRESHVEEVFGR